MTRATIIKGNINNNLWQKVFLVMTYIKNIQQTGTLEGESHT